MLIWGSGGYCCDHIQIYTHLKLLIMLTVRLVSKKVIGFLKTGYNTTFYNKNLISWYICIYNLYIPVIHNQGVGK